jgi:hypothetical protein
VHLFCVLVAALRWANSPSKESYRLCIDQETEKAAKVHKGCKAIDSFVEHTRFNENVANYFSPDRFGKYEYI